MRRALIVTHSYYLRDTRPRRHAEALAAAGWEVEVLCARDEGESASERAGEIFIRRLPARRRRGSKFRYIWEYSTFGFMSACVISWLYLRKRYDLVYVFSIPNILVLSAALPKWLGAGVILDVRDPMPEFFQSKYSLSDDHPLVRALLLEERMACRFATRVLTVHEPMRELLSRTGRLPDDIAVVLNVPDMSVFRAAQGIPRDSSCRTVLYAGTVATRYGVDLLVEALPLLKDEIEALRVQIVGDGDAVPRLRRRARELGVEDRVDFTGPVRLTQMPQIIARAWVGAQPHRDDELMRYCFSTKIFEWGALGLPVVCAKTPAIVASFSDSEIRYVRPGSLDDLCEALREIDADPTSSLTRASALQAAVGRFDWTLERESLLTLVRATIAPRSPS